MEQKVSDTKIDPSAADSCHRRQPESSGAASRKTDGTPPSQPKLWGAVAAEIFTACCGL